MIPWELLDRAPVPGSASELRLQRRGTEYSITVDGHELMNSGLHGSEDALAEEALTRRAETRNPRVLIGGLGMGYTLAAALARLGHEAQVTVAELVPAVVTWNRGPLAHLAGNPLADPRVTVAEGDVALQFTPATWDAILLDVDNGPGALTHPDNEKLYGAPGLRKLYAALRPGGILGVWSVAVDDAFDRRLRALPWSVEQLHPRARKTRGGRHTVWIAKKTA